MYWLIHVSDMNVTPGCHTGVNVVVMSPWQIHVLYNRFDPTLSFFLFVVRIQWTWWVEGMESLDPEISQGWVAGA